MSKTKIDGHHLGQLIISGAGELAANKELVDSMNVFPVPDGDTGTNMSLTVLAAAKGADNSAEKTAGEVAKLVASGALRGARGNSGVIVSQLFRGFAKALEGRDDVDLHEIANAFEEGVKTAYKAVMKPREGTILTVARACSESALKLCHETEDGKEFLKGVIAYGHEVLNQTPEMLPVLKEAGVVDAGGRGLLFILEGALKYLNGEEISTIQSPVITTTQDFSKLSSIDHDNITFGYCTEFFINSPNTPENVTNQLTQYLGSIGDSVVCVSDEDIVKIHVHTDNPGLALERAMKIGSLSGIKIDNMREQHSAIMEQESNAQNKAESIQNQPKKDIGFVSISVGAGFSEIFKNLGANVVIEGGQTMNPSTEDIINAVDTINADTVIILPNNKNIILAAEQAVELCDKKVIVIPTKSVPQGISAMICNAEGVSADDMAEEMREVIESVNTVAMTYAVRDTVMDNKEIVSGDILGMLNDEISVVGKEVQQATKDTLDNTITEDSELVGIYYGEDVSEEMAQEIADYIEEKYGDCEVEVHNGQQPLYGYIISVE